jgi:hypothetical protein
MKALFITLSILLPTFAQANSYQCKWDYKNITADEEQKRGEFKGQLNVSDYGNTKSSWKLNFYIGYDDLQNPDGNKSFEGKSIEVLKGKISFQQMEQKREIKNALMLLTQLMTPSAQPSIFDDPQGASKVGEIVQYQLMGQDEGSNSLLHPYFEFILVNDNTGVLIESWLFQSGGVPGGFPLSVKCIP